MRWIPIVSIVCLSSAPLVAGAAPAAAAAVAEEAAPSAEQRLGELEKQFALMQRQMAQLRAQIAAEAEARVREDAAVAGELAAGLEEAEAAAAAAARDAEEAGRAAVAAAEPVAAWEAGYVDGGGGFYLRSPEGDLQLRQLGYVQFVGSVFHHDFVRDDAPGDFSIRRARLDWLVDLHDRYQLFVELDGGPGSTPGSSDFALVEAKLTVDLDESGTLQFIGGKYVSPFSTENLLSSRSLDTVERYVALNSMFLLPALDVQYGAMLRGYALDRKLEVMAGVFNGNGRANDNLSDDNGDKEVQLKLNYRPSEAAKLGLGFDYSHEEAQSLQLRGLSFTPWVAVPVEGTRRAVSADFSYAGGAWSLRGEGLWADFDDSGAELYGGFVQAARYLRGDGGDGLQGLVRVETASLDSALLGGPLGDRIDAVTLALNWFWRGNYRLQVDAVGERYDGLSNLPAGGSRVEGDGWKPYLLTELQVKF